METKEKGKKSTSSSSKPLEYEVRHLQAYEGQNWKWPPDLDSEPELAKALEHMPRRQIECAWYYTKLAQANNIDAEHIVDLNMSIDFSSAMPRPNVCACLVSTAKPYAVKRQRDLCGYEALNLQGLWHTRLRPV
eukprot:7320760-Heterocapsa_arctica.AAC.1